MGLRKKYADPLEVALEVAGQALSTFEDVVDDLDFANELLQQEKDAALAAVSWLNDRVNTAQAAINNNERVVGKIKALLA